MYIKNIDTYTQKLIEVNKRYNIISSLRLVIFALAVYFIREHMLLQNWLYLGIGLSLFIGFVIILKKHKQLRFKKKKYSALLTINNNEKAFVENNELPFDDGSEYVKAGHNYSFDLDIFGKNSLYQFLNRTHTFMGKAKLSTLLSSLLPNMQILENQKAVDELSGKLNFRQEIMATAMIYKDNEKVNQYLLKWSEEPINKLPFWLSVLMFLFPLIFVVCVAIVVVTGNPLFLYISELVFVLNLGVLVTQLKKILGIISKISKIDKIIFQYSIILSKIESQAFKSKKLQDLQSKLKTGKLNSSESFGQLSSIFQRIESIQNGMAAIILNGSFLYHLFAYKSLIKWQINKARYVKKWLDIIGEFEALGSLANYKYNNPSYCYPKLNNNKNIEFTEMGHPLIPNRERVNNDVAFLQHKFVILTGSNMSGKSTYLRSLGINMVLAGIGAPVCAGNANVHPLSIIVSMRLSDSLSDNESYFYTEVKRLKYIMDHLDNNDSLVLLDEILRGTNSDDKRNGTINVIKKLISKKAIGVIATHDLEVCKTTDLYPDYLANKCFEVEIINNDLLFDYKMRSGICQNQSASFLMKKMEII